MSRDVQRGWRVGHQGRDGMYYEELRDGAWERIEVQGEMLMGRAHHVIYFASPAQWARYPAWARHRRAEIVARIKSELREPDYEYYESDDGPAASGSTMGPPPPGAPVAAQVAGAPRGTRPTAIRASQKEMRALYVAIALLVATAVGMAWLVANGMASGETVFPARLTSHRRTVVRVEEPVAFWMSIGLYAAIGLGALGLGGWGMWAGRELGKPETRRG